MTATQLSTSQRGGGFPFPYNFVILFALLKKNNLPKKYPLLILQFFSVHIPVFWLTSYTNVILYVSCGKYYHRQLVICTFSYIRGGGSVVMVHVPCFSMSWMTRVQFLRYHVTKELPKTTYILHLRPAHRDPLCSHVSLSVPGGCMSQGWMAPVP